MIEVGFRGPPPEKLLVIFMQNGAILGNTNGYICLDIMAKQQDNSLILKPTDM